MSHWRRYLFLFFSFFSSSSHDDIIRCTLILLMLRLSSFYCCLFITLKYIDIFILYSIIKHRQCIALKYVDNLYVFTLYSKYSLYNIYFMITSPLNFTYITCYFQLLVFPKCVVLIFNEFMKFVVLW